MTAALAAPMMAEDPAWSKMGIREVERVARHLRSQAVSARYLALRWTGDTNMLSSGASAGVWALVDLVDAHARSAEAHVEGRRCPQRAPCRNGSFW